MKFPIFPCLLFGLVILSGCHNSQPTQPGLQKDRTNTQVTLVEPVEFQPFTYFAQSCARCHGPNGSHYGEAFGKELTDHELVEIIDEMAYGPGMAPLDEKELQVMTAYHRGLLDNRPFIVVNQITEESMQGEVMPGTSLAIHLNGRQYPITVDEDHWQFEFPTGINTNSLTEPPILHANREGKVTKLNLTKMAYSHHKKLDKANHHENEPQK